MSIIRELQVASQNLFEHIKVDLPNNPDARDEFIDKIGTLLADRQKIIDQLKDYEMNSDEKQLAQQIVTVNKAIDERLKTLQLQIKRDINVFRDKKVKNKKYDNPYDGPMIEGAFIDKRGI